MYAVVVFALALLSPLPFVSPFDNIVQDATAQSSTNVPFDVPSLEIISNLVISPFGVIENGTNGFHSIVDPRKINTFQIGNSIYAGVHSVASSDSFTIVNITDPSSPSQVSVLDPTVNNLFTMTDAAYTVIDGSTYAISVSENDDRVLIINVSNPSLPSLVTYVTDGTDYPGLDGPSDIATIKIGTSTFALVTAKHDRSVQIMDITDPSNPAPAYTIYDGVDGYTELNNPYSVTTITLDSSIFALVAARDDNGVQIINITDPYNPTPASTAGLGRTYPQLHGAYDVTTITLDSSTFALVAGRYNQGIQIIDITDPYNPAPVSAIRDGEGGYTELYNVASIATITIGTSTFALAVAALDSGVQIIDITDPYNPSPVSAFTDNVGGYNALSAATYIVTTTVDESIYAFVTAPNDNAIQIIKLGPEYISTHTDNQNPKYAKAGDTLDVYFTSIETIESHTSQILGFDVNATVNGTVYGATVTVPSTPRESYATFTIKVANANGTSVTVTENDISSNVFIDTISPSIELVGSADYTVSYGTLDPSIPDVIVSDGDPNYMGGFTLVKNATVDTTIPGSVYIYTYTANLDAAGNPGSSISRIVTVTDTSSSETPQNLIVSPFGVIQNGVNGFDSIERPSRIGTFQIGDSIYAGVSGNFSFTIVNITDPSSPSQVTVLDTTVDSMFALSVGEYVVIDGFTYAISGSDDDESVLIINISNPSLPSLVTHITHGADYTGLDNPFGITTVTINSSTYALVTAFNGDGVQIIDITDPSNPSPVSVITDGVGGYKELDGAIHVTTVTIDSSTYALVASVWDNGVQIIDITDPYNPAPASAITNGVGGYTELFHPHAVTTVTIDSSTFAIVTAISGDGVQIIDITDPYNPAPVSALTDGRDGFTELDGPYGITITTIGASTYAIVASVWGDGVQIIDITDPYNPTPASAITDGVDGYTELHRAIHVTTVTIDSSTYALVAGKYDDGIQIIKIEPEYISAHTSNQNPPFEITPNLAISPFGSIQNGINGFDSIVDPRKINTFQIGNSIYAGVHSVASSDSFTIVNITDPSSPSQVSVLDPTVNNLFTMTDAAYTVIDGSTYAISVSENDDRVLIINVSNPSLPSLVTYVTDGTDYPGLDGPSDIATIKIGTSTFALVTAKHDRSVQIMDITDPSNPAPAYTIYDGVDGYTELNNPYSVTTITLDSSIFALVAARDDNGVQIINITDPYNPTPASTAGLGRTYPQLHGAYDVTTITLDSSTFALVAGRYNQGIQIIDITDPYNPAPVSAIRDGEGGYTELYNVASIATITIGTSTFALAVAALDSGVQIIDITDPYNPSPVSAFTDNVGGYDTLSAATYIVTTTVDESIYAFVTAPNDDGIQIIKIEPYYISAHTSNQNPKYAKAGDTLDVYFTSIETIESHTSQILGFDVNATVNGTVYGATVTVPSTPRESYATFTIKVANANGTSVTVTENDISSNVFIDTISPSIELIDSADYTIPYGTLDPSIPDVTVSDGDPNYMGGFTLVKNATVDTTILGSVYIYTYTANPDAAGNPGSTISRIVTVTDTSSSETPQNLIVSPFGVIQNGVNGFDSIERPSRIGTFQIGDSIYAGVSGNFSFTIVNITDPSSPSQVTVLDTTVDSMFALSVGEYVVIDGFTYAISGSDDDESVLIINISNPSLPSLVTHITHGADYTGLDNPFGITTVTINSSTYALVTAFNGDGVQIIDITDPSNPSPVSVITDGVGGYKELDGAIHVTTVTIDSSTYALVASVWDNGVQIIDITDPYNPAPASAITNGVGGYTELFHPHAVTTVTIDSSTFAIVTAISGDGVQIIDITDPYNPTPVSALTDGRDGFTELDGPYGITITTIGASTYAIVASVWGDGVQIIDITDPYNPTPASAITDGVDGYTELHRAIHVTTVTIDSSTYALVAGKYDDGIQIIKIEPEYISAHTSNQNPPFEITPNLAISPFGSIQNGINGFDSIVDPRKINTFQIGNSIYAGVHSVASSDSFTIVNITDPSSPSQVSVLDPTVNNLFTMTDAAYTVIDGSTYAISVSENDDRVLIINVSNPSLPSLVTYVTDGTDYPGLDGPSDIATIKIGTSTFALVTAKHDRSVQIMDITDPSNPAPAYTIYDGVDGYTELNNPYSVTTITLDSSIFALVAARDDNGVQIINITDPYNPTPASTAGLGRTYPQLHGAYDVTTITLDSSTFALVAGRYNQGIQIIDITDPYNPAPVSAIRDGEGGYTELYNVASIATITIGTSTFALAVAALDSGVQIIDITDPYNPSPVSAFTDNVGGYDTLSAATYIVTTTVDESIYAFVTAPNDDGIQIIKIEPYYISAHTSNQNPKYAKAGDTLDVYFTSIETIESHTSQILGFDVNATVNGTVYGATVTVPSTPRESYATFTIKVANANGTSVTVTENDISSNVFIDTISPSIELIDSADYTIPYGTLDPSIPDVTVSDGDPNYMGGFTLVKNATVDTTILGSVYIYTYTANPDAAGNPGSTISRIVTVTDTSSSETPQNLIVSPFGVIQNGVNGFDSIERPSRIGTFQIGDSIYAGVSGNFSFTIVNITDPSSPSQVTVLDTTVDSMFALSVGEYVVIDGFTYAISGSDDDESVLIINISNPSLPSLVTHITHGADYTGLDNPFGITTVTINSSTYALVTAFNGDGVQIIDITDPSNPSPVSVITDGVGGYKELDGAIHVTTVTIDSSTYALVASVWDNGVQIIDITDPYNPAPASAITNGVGGYTELFHPHAVTTVTIDSSTFAIVTAISGDGVQIIDITDPYNPTPASALTDGRDGFTELDGPYGITITTIGASTYAIVASVWGDGVQIIDITDPYNPTPASAITDGVDGYTELHRAIHVTTVTIDSSTYALVAGKYDDGIQIIKIEPEYISAHTSNQNPPFEITPNLVISPFGSIQNGTNGFDSIERPIRISTFEIDNSIYAGVTSAKSKSFTIVNITDPSSPSQVTVLDPSVNSLFAITDAEYSVIDGFTYAISISSHNDRVLIINVSNPSLPSLVTYVEDGANYTELEDPLDVTIATIDTSIFALVAAFDDNGVQIIDITDPSNPTPASAIRFDNDYTKLNGPISITTIAIGASTFALVSSVWSNGVQIIDITDPYNPSPASAVSNGVDGYTELFHPHSIAAVTIGTSTFALAAAISGDGVQIIDITDPYNPIPASALTDGRDGFTELDGSRFVTTIAIDTSMYALVAGFYDNGVQIIDITDPYNPIPASALADGEDGYTKLHNTESIIAVTIDSSAYALVASSGGIGGVQIIKLGQEYISAYTSNQNPKYAKAGDILEINFATSDTISSHTSQILGLNASATVNGAIYDTTVTIPSTPRESYATFTIQVENANGESITVTENDISSNVFIDTISPSIELVGSADYTVSYGTLDPSIPNVTVSDGDPNYLGGFTLVKNTTVDTTIPGSIYSYTYTANSDRSGNAGNSVTRTILVVDNSSSNTSCMDPESSYNIITGNDSSKVLNGTAGNDLIYGTEGNDIINGLGGNDCIFGNGGDDMIDGGDGKDTINGNGGNDIIFGGFGNDMILGGPDNDTLYGGDGMDTINGNAGDDELFGEGNDDTINGNAGNDIISGGSGNDIVIGGLGNDTLYGGDGNDTINGNAGDDELFGDGNDDTIYGNNGNDVISGGSGHDTISGNTGDDVLIGGLGDDIIQGGSGMDAINGSLGDDELFGEGNDDTINGNGGNDIISGGFGNDIVIGGPDNDTLYGGGGNDTINGNDGDDELFGEGNDDTIYGNAGNDVISGGSGHDTISGNDGDDVMIGGLGHDIIKGGSGMDAINGSVGDDELFGEGNDDTIYGNAGNDVISGGYGHDTLYGESGDDIINGDGGDDVISGGSGNDVITGGPGHDIIVNTQPDDIVHVASSGASSNYKLRD